MNLLEEILKAHSKQQYKKIVQRVGNFQQRFDELFNFFLNAEYRVTQRAAWPLGYCVETQPAFIKKHFKKLINNLRNPDLHNAIKRNTVRLLQYVDIPEKL